MRKILPALLLAAASWAATAQPRVSAEVRDQVDASVRAVGAEHDCEISVPGREHRFDDFAGAWLINYHASGPECDAAGEDLQRRGAAEDLLFVRRPTSDQLMIMIRPMLRSVSSVSACRISLSGTPSFEPVSGRWSVTYMASGDDCEHAAEALRDAGDPLHVTFIRRHAPRTLLQ